MIRLLCKKCGWHIDDVAMKPFCPDCKKERLWHIKGTKEEIEQKTKEVKFERER